ncbi:MAG: hypothetical protein ABH840_04730 [Nanoarchaeota archaeon]
MDLKMGEKGQIFTTVAIALIALFLLIYGAYSIVESKTQVKMRVSTMENFLFSLEENLEREVYITGFRTLFLAEDSITKSGQFISDVDYFFEEAFFNGTVSGNSSDILIGAKYSDMLQFIKQRGESINVNVSISNPEISVFHENPWNVAVLFTFNLTMIDNAGVASWNKQERIKSLISIEGFEDPLYIINSNGKVLYKINKSAGESLQDHLENRMYQEDIDAPSFLKRLEGSIQPDSNGIESLVDLEEFSQQGLGTKDKSAVDHIYFSINNPPASNVQGMPSWFKLDVPHLSKYNATAS